MRKTSLAPFLLTLALLAGIAPARAANPTTNPPAQAVFSSSLGFGATAKSMIAGGTTAGLPVELVGQVAGRTWEGLSAQGVGYSPRFKPAGFPYTPSASPSLKFGYGSPSIWYTGRGFNNGDGATRTYAVVFRHDAPHPGLSNISHTYPLVRSWSRADGSTTSGIMVQTGVAGMAMFGIGNSSAVVAPSQYASFTLNNVGATAGTYTITVNNGVSAATTTALNYFASASGTNSVQSAINALGLGTSACTGGPSQTAPITITFSSLYNYTLTLNAGGLTGGTQTLVNTVEPYLIQAGTWYAAAFSTDQTGPSGSYKYKMQLYNYATQTLSTVYEITNSTTATGLPTVGNPADLVVGGDMSADFAWRGQVAAVLLDKEYWTSTQFNSFVADPWATARGTYTASGALTAPTTGYFTHGEGGCQLSFPPATGIGTGGTGAPAYYLQRYTDPTTAPSPSYRVGSAITPDGGGQVVNALDTTSVAGTTYWYRLECVDGSSTVYYPSAAVTPLLGRRRASATPLFVTILCDSRWEGSTTIFAGMVARKLDRPVCHVNKSKSGLYSWNWSNGVNNRMQVGITGTPTSGTFFLSAYLGSGTTASFTGIPYNCSAGLLQTILQDNSGTYGAVNASNTAGIGGAGNVTCSGGPLPGTPITIDFNGPTSGNTFLGSFSGSTTNLNNGATPSATVIWRGCPADSVNLGVAITELTAVLAEDPDLVPYAYIAVGENDSAYAATQGVYPVDYGRYLASGAAALVAAGAKVCLAAPPLIRSPTVQSQTPHYLLQAQQYGAAIAGVVDGVNTFYLGDRTLQLVALEPLGSLDGEHSMSGGSEGSGERWGAAEQFCNVVSPPASGVSRPRRPVGVSLPAGERPRVFPMPIPARPDVTKPATENETPKKKAA